jgi:hypothetical protein
MVEVVGLLVVVDVMVEVVVVFGSAARVNATVRVVVTVLLLVEKSERSHRS